MVFKAKLLPKYYRHYRHKHHHTPDDKNGPAKSALLSFGPVEDKYESTVPWLGIGCFGELYAGFNGVCMSIARSRAVSYVGRYDDKSPKEALGMSHSRARRVWGHAAVISWSDLILDRSRKLDACATRTGGDSDPNSRTTTFPRPVCGHRARCSCPFVASEPRHRRQALVSRAKCEGALVDSC